MSRPAAGRASLASLPSLALLAACAIDVPLPERGRVDLAPPPSEAGAPGEAGESFALAPSAEPMYRELLAVDLETVVRTALARNLDIELARGRAAAARGEAARAAGALFPVLSPGLFYEQVDGAVRATAGSAVDVTFHTWAPSVLASLVVNPGRASFERVAARKRLLAAKHDERAVEVETLRRAAAQYHELVLARARVDATGRSVAEADELLRVTRSRVRSGAALRADERSAEAERARREQELVRALLAFERGSLELALTLDLDASVTLAPADERMAMRVLVRDDLPIDELLAVAVEHRDELHAVRALAGAADAEVSAARWSALGPTAALGARYGGIRGRAKDAPGIGGERFSLHEQRRIAVGGDAELSYASFAGVDVARAVARLAGTEAAEALAVVRAQVVAADRERRAQSRLAPLARAELDAADEALRLALRQLEAGTLTAFDVAQRESAAARARLALAESVVRFNQSQVDLLAALGILDSAVRSP